VAEKKRKDKKARMKDLKSRKLSSGKAGDVKGGFDPQPDPPRLRTRLINPVLSQSPTIIPCI